VLHSNMGNPIDKRTRVEIKFPAQGPALGLSTLLYFDTPAEDLKAYNDLCMEMVKYTENKVCE
jgi:hypothetical protein